MSPKARPSRRDGPGSEHAARNVPGPVVADTLPAGARHAGADQRHGRDRSKGRQVTVTTTSSRTNRERRRSARWAAWSLWALTMLLVALAGVIVAASPAAARYAQAKPR